MDQICAIMNVQYFINYFLSHFIKFFLLYYLNINF